MSDRKTLIEVVNELGHLPVIPLLGFPGRQITKTTLKQNMFNYGLHFQSILGLVDEFEPDAIFPMMDLTLEVNALGAPVRFDLMAPPSVDNHLVNTDEDLEALEQVDILKDGRVHAFLETMRLMAKNFDIFCAGYVIGPYTMASQLMGASSAAKAVIRRKDFLHKLLAFSNHVIGVYANALVEAGADMICVLEPSSMTLSPKQFDEFSGDYLKELYTKFDAIPILHICGNTTHLMDNMVATGAEGLSLDTAVIFPEVIDQVPDDVVLIGNINPVEIMLQSTPEEVYELTGKLIKDMQGHANFILSTGCDMPEDTPFENLRAFMNAGRGLALDAKLEKRGVLTAPKAQILAEFRSPWQLK